MFKQTEIAARILTLALLIHFCGCWSSDPEPEPEAKEIKVSKSLNSDAPEADVFNTAKRLYQSEMYSVARESFQTIRDGFPTGPYAEFAELKVADCHFFATEYTEAAALYEEFTKNHPGNSDVPYAKLQAARSYFLSNRGVGRNRVPLEKSVELFNAVIVGYPESSFSRVAQSERQKAVERLAEYDQMVMKFYEKHDNADAVQARQAIFETKWKPEIEKVVPLPEEQPLTNTPATVVVAAADSPKDRSEKNDSLVKAALTPPRIREKAPPSGSSQVSRVQCRSGEHPFAMIELSTPVGLSDADLTPENGIVKFDLPGVRSAGSILDCFGSKDLTVSQNGVVAIRANSPAHLTTLSEPPRVLVLF